MVGFGLPCFFINPKNHNLCLFLSTGFEQINDRESNFVESTDNPILRYNQINVASNKFL